MDSGLAVWRTCFECWLEPRAAELPRNDGPIAGEESVQRPTVEYARRQGRGKVACDRVCGCWLAGDLMTTTPRCLIDTT